MKRIFLLVSFVWLFGCSEDSSTAPDESNGEYNYVMPSQLDDGLEVASAGSVNLSEELLENMLTHLDRTDNHEIHAVLVLKDNKLVFEKYFRGFEYSQNPPGPSNHLIDYNNATKNFMASVTKSITSIIAGAALDRGLINSLDDSLHEYYPTYDEILVGNKRNITLRRLLDMTSGLAFDEYSYPYGDSRNDISGMWVSSDPMRFLFSKELETEPGEIFYYNSGSPNIIADLVGKVSSMTFKEFADENVFGKLGITDYSWERFNNGNYFASGGLHMKARDLLKLGYLYLNDGMWDGERIVSSEWIEESTEIAVSTPGWGNSTGYSKYWWFNSAYVNGRTYNYYYATGWGDQYLFVLPSHNLAAVFLSGHFNSQPISPFELFRLFVLKGLIE